MDLVKFKVAGTKSNDADGAEAHPGRPYAGTAKDGRDWKMVAEQWNPVLSCSAYIVKSGTES